MTNLEKLLATRHEILYNRILYLLLKKTDKEYEETVQTKKNN